MLRLSQRVVHKRRRAAFADIRDKRDWLASSQMCERSQIVCPQGDGLPAQQEPSTGEPILLPGGNCEDVSPGASVGKFDSRQMKIVTDRKHARESEFLTQRHGVRNRAVRIPAIFVDENSLRRHSLPDRVLTHGLRFVNVSAARPTGHHQESDETLSVKFDTCPDAVFESRRQSAIRINTAPEDDSSVCLPPIVRLPKAVNLQQREPDAASERDAQHRSLLPKQADAVLGRAESDQENDRDATQHARHKK